VYNGAHEQFKLLSNEEKSSVKNEYTQGCEYFVFAGALHPRKNVVKLLEGFTYFKKKQRSDMKLLIVGRYAWNSDQIRQAIEHHPFKADVVHLDYMNLDKLSKI
jgi:hypothetical protein